MRLITLTNLFPSADMPRHGVFIRERLEHIVETGRVEARVVALRPGGAGRCDCRPPVGLPKGMEVRYRTVPSAPMVSNWVDPVVWAMSVAASVRDAVGADVRNAVIDAHFLYPDGVAGVLLGRRLGIPVVVSARGSDVNVKCRNPIMRAWIRWSAARANAFITVSQALADALQNHDVQPRHLAVIPNGVDHRKFAPKDRAACQARFGVKGRVLASVGHLTTAKGHALAIEAITEMPGFTLLIVGEGPERERLERLAQKRGVSHAVVFAGMVAHAEMADVYSAADVLVLASEREGMPNVVLESLACGTPVVATDVGGVREVVRVPIAGELISERSGVAIRSAVSRVVRASTDCSTVRQYSKAFEWGPLVERQLALYEKAIGDGPVGMSPAPDVTVS